jgi:hypothetical protein
MKATVFFCTMLLVKAISPEMFNELSGVTIILTVIILVLFDIVGFIMKLES